MSNNQKGGLSSALTILGGFIKKAWNLAMKLAVVIIVIGGLQYFGDLTGIGSLAIFFGMYLAWYFNFFQKTNRDDK